MVSLKVLDLFAGLKGWSEPFERRGHEVFSIDNDVRFDVDLHADIETLDTDILPWVPDIILASPPCQAFSVMTIGRNWTIEHTPKTEKAELAIRLVEATRRIIEELSPIYFVIENPRAKLRKLEVFQDYERRTVTYCQYGEKFMKPTDLWGGFPESLELKPICKNGAPCHTPASRGSVTGIQGPIRNKFIRDEKNKVDLSALRSKIPYPLALSVCLAAEKDILGEMYG